MSYGPPPSVYTESALEVGRRGKRRRRLVLGALAAAVALACLVVWTGSYGGEPGSDGRPAVVKQAPDAIRRTVETPPESPEGKAAFRYREEIRQVGATAAAPGAWATGKIFAKGFVNYIKGFSLSKPARLNDERGDRAAWQLRFPGPLCATTRHVSAAGWTAVAFAGKPVDPKQVLGTPCDRLAVVDIDTGRKLWQTALPSGDSPPTNVNVTMTDGTVAVAWDQGSAAYDMTHGKRLWVHTLADCMDTGFAGGGKLLALVECGDSAQPEFRIERVDPRTGRTQWRYRVARGIKEVYLASSSPAVIAVAAGDYTVTDLLSLDEQGRARATIRLDDDHQVVDCDKPFSAVVESCPSIVVGRRQVFISTNDDIVAFDLGTGKSGMRFPSPTGATMIPLKMSGDQLIAYRGGGGVAPCAVVSLDPAKGKERFLLLFSWSDDDLSGLDKTDDEFFYEQGRLYYAATSVYGPRNKGEVGGLSNIAEGIESVA
ncbi:PQQ-binding-like beta-propeller repeat protein [Streptomyces sp. NPDC051636]|uniref:outer membrane protein assembly factor BamB family protein n=1 Tax=Streptomyces sp. NPDC051636 TaxID=3365663 RepID=UPI0037906F9A